MTDKEIIKAFNDACVLDCMNVYLWSEKHDKVIVIPLKKIASLIHRQKAEIERLKGKVNLLIKYDERTDINLHARLADKAKAEAIKEFAERLKVCAGFNEEWGEAAVCCCEIDNLVKEMVGDDNNSPIVDKQN